jgi:ketosteroid isomerase-like protein
METASQRQEIERLEHAFWSSLVERQPDVATGMLTEPALMVSQNGAMRFDHAAYRKMADDDRHRLLDFQLSDMDVVFPTPDVAVATSRVSQSMQNEDQRLQQQAVDSSTWVRVGRDWKCVAHTESLVGKA